MADSVDGGSPACSWYHAFGVQAASGAVSYLDNSNVLYPVGRHLVINDPMDLKDKEGGNMAFIPIEHPVGSIAISSDKSYVAVVENILSADPAANASQISVYRMDTHKPKRLHLKEAEGVDFGNVISIAWSGDSKHLVIMTGDPNRALVYWNVQTNKLVTWISIEDEAVARISIHPDDPNQIIATGCANCPPDSCLHC